MKGKNLFWGLFFLAAAAFLVVSSFGGFMQFSFWTVIVAILLVAVLIQSITQLNFFGMTLPVALGYLIFQKPLHLQPISAWILIAAAVFVAVGLEMLFGRFRKNKKSENRGGGHVHQTNGGYRPDAQVTDARDEDNNPSAKVNFGATSQYIHSTALESGHFEVSFGSMEVYLDQAVLAPSGAVIDVNCSFGAIKFYIPKSWQVRDEIGATLGGVENDRRFSAPDPNSPVLQIVGNVSFGGVEIQYV